MKFTASVLIRMKKGLLDPQGTTIGGSLKSLGFAGISDVKVGKLIEIALEAKGKAEAGKMIENMCKKLLANPVIEVFNYEIKEAAK